ncbi:MAG: hypothetical protein M3M89_02180 [Thermoproteota archaeon]|nr:hypothetical protein [Thermoproteota archaeon]
MIASLNTAGIAEIINVCVQYVTIVINEKQTRRRRRNTLHPAAGLYRLEVAAGTMHLSVLNRGYIHFLR